MSWLMVRGKHNGSEQAHKAPTHMVSWTNRRLRAYEAKRMLISQLAGTPRNHNEITKALFLLWLKICALTLGNMNIYVGNINQPILERGIGTNTHLSQKMAQTGAYIWDYMCIQWLCWLQQSIWNFYNAV